jgi:outer membrane protein OmpA-like peptidoglycan-associated protein
MKTPTKKAMPWVLCLLLGASAIPVVAAGRQTAVQLANIDVAAAALTAAERMGAPLYAKELYGEASARLRWARDNYNSDKSSKRNEASLRADEALYAARAAEAKAMWAQVVNQATSLRIDITTFGGTVPAMNLQVEPEVTIDRGATSKARVQVAEAAIARARVAGASGSDLQPAEDKVKTARTILKTQNQSDSAEHLAYVAEMIARRAEYMARMGDADKMIPALRLERTRLAKAAADVQAAQERQRREDAERQAADLRARLATEAADRQIQADELARLREQMAQRDTEVRVQLDRDRQARLDAELKLDQVMGQYETALSTARSGAEVDALRRQVEDQQLALRMMQDRESQSEQGFRQEIDRLQQDLDRQKQQGGADTQALSAREAELTRQREELDRLHNERQAAEQKRIETQRVHEQAIAAAEQRVQQAQAEANRLKVEVEAQKSKQQQTEAELAQAKSQLSQRDEADRTAKMQAELARLAKTRTDSRGFIVTLPGIFFDTGKSALKPGAISTLKKIGDQLKGNDQVKISVEGHTDSVGSEATNQGLSEARAAAVRDALVSAGVTADRITVVGRGEAAPVTSNKTAAGRQQNRRVELIITQ